MNRSFSIFSVLLILLAVPTTIAASVVENYYPNTLPEYATAYIGMKTGIWPDENISGLQVWEIFMANDVKNMGYIATRESAQFPIYNETSAMHIIGVLDPQTGKPVLDSVLGGPYLTTSDKDGKIIIRRLLVRDENTSEIKMIFLPI